MRNTSTLPKGAILCAPGAGNILVCDVVTRIFPQVPITAPYSFTHALSSHVVKTNGSSTHSIQNNVLLPAPWCCFPFALTKHRMLPIPPWYAPPKTHPDEPVSQFILARLDRLELLPSTGLLDLSDGSNAVVWGWQNATASAEHEV